MGYYSSYSLTIYNINELDKDLEIINELRKESDEATYALDEYGGCSESSKWYGSNKELKEFSKKYPDLIFELSRKGESTEDMYKYYIKNGKIQSCKAMITYDSYDENKLV